MYFLEYNPKIIYIFWITFLKIDFFALLSVDGIYKKECLHCGHSLHSLISKFLGIALPSY